MSDASGGGDGAFYVGGSGSGSVTLTASGTTTIASNNTIISIFGATGYTLALPTFNLNAASGKLNPTTANVIVGGITTLTTSAATLTLEGSALSNSVTGTINNGPGGTSVVVNGGGSWLFSNSNTYGGGTTISGGTLLTNNVQGLGVNTGTVAITLNGGVLALLNDQSVTFDPSGGSSGYNVTVGANNGTIDVRSQYERRDRRPDVDPGQRRPGQQ